MPQIDPIAASWAMTTMLTQDGWTWYSMEPDIFTHEDGRLKLLSDGQVLILPSPAAEILRDAKLRMSHG